MGAQPLMHRQPNFIVVPELRSTQRMLQWTEDVKIRRREVSNRLGTHLAHTLRELQLVMNDVMG